MAWHASQERKKEKEAAGRRNTTLIGLIGLIDSLAWDMGPYYPWAQQLERSGGIPAQLIGSCPHNPYERFDPKQW